MTGCTKVGRGENAEYGENESPERGIETEEREDGNEHTGEGKNRRRTSRRTQTRGMRDGGTEEMLGVPVQIKEKEKEREKGVALIRDGAPKEEAICSWREREHVSSCTAWVDSGSMSVVSDCIFALVVVVGGGGGSVADVMSSVGDGASQPAIYHSVSIISCLAKCYLSLGLAYGRIYHLRNGRQGHFPNPVPTSWWHPVRPIRERKFVKKD
ncbi:hypothetical protein B0H17DRAFT_1150085 [Mycena rosella]|uniref:Uncharacterized protein n=1 Tax=Mycena rosella TaxID=1033263 RepID=A0AAD7BV94_MYCRO|nr:hypothetical protein B0H17DRAFT_1150085 [Mycena rosella]